MTNVRKHVVYESATTGTAAIECSFFRELQAILQAMVGTPLGAPPTTTVAGFPNPLTSFIPGPSTTASTTASLASVSNGSSEGSGLKVRKRGNNRLKALKKNFATNVR